MNLNTMKNVNIQKESIGKLGQCLRKQTGEN